jgi:hypothetical protein
MAFLAQLWLPIVVSAVLVFVLSAVTHMMVPFRKIEWGHLPTQDAIRAALRGATPGLYMFPIPAEVSERGKAESMSRWVEGPSGWLTLVHPGPMSWGRNLGLSFLMNLFVSFSVAYVATLTLGAVSLQQIPHERVVFRVVATIGFLAYAVGPIYDAVWFWKPWRSLAMTAVDSLLYGLVMGGAFAWLWPS